MAKFLKQDKKVAQEIEYVFFALAKKLNEREDFSLNETDKNVR